MARHSETGPLGNVLIIAYHFPPQAGSSGSLRTMKYCRYLPEFGWQPAVLTPHSRAYEKIDEKSLNLIPKGVPVIRSFAMDTKKQMGIGGRYLRYMALPDRWVSWVFGGVPAGLRAVRKHKTEILYSTFPIMSAALIGLWLQRFTGLPWVLDLRDPMSQEDYPRDPLVRRVWTKVERACMRRVSRVIFTAEATRQMYLERYPEFLKSIPSNATQGRCSAPLGDLKRWDASVRIKFKLFFALPDQKICTASSWLREISRT